MRKIITTVVAAAVVGAGIVLAAPAQANVTPRPTHTVRCTVVGHVTLPVKVDGTRVHPVLVCSGGAGTRPTAHLG